MNAQVQNKIMNNEVSNKKTVVGATVYDVQGDVVIYKKETQRSVSGLTGNDYIFIDYNKNKEVGIFILALVDTEKNRSKYFKKVFEALNAQQHETR